MTEIDYCYESDSLDTRIITVLLFPGLQTAGLRFPFELRCCEGNLRSGRLALKMMIMKKKENHSAQFYSGIVVFHKSIDKTIVIGAIIPYDKSYSQFRTLNIT